MWETNYDACRNIRKYKLKRIDSFFKNRGNFNVINILFPHVWQIKQQKDDRNFKIKLGIHRRVCIIKEIIEFVNRTKRFKREIWFLTVFYLILFLVTSILIYNSISYDL